jgi:hypothetical protein
VSEAQVGTTKIYLSLDDTREMLDIRATNAIELLELLLLVRILTVRSWDSVVVIATGLRAGRPRGRSSSPGRVKNFLFSTQSSPPSPLSNGYRGLFHRK